jgi:hypothetical protein
MYADKEAFVVDLPATNTVQGEGAKSAPRHWPKALFCAIMSPAKS